MAEFKAELQTGIERVDREIQRFLPEESGRQRLILEACNYSVRNGGKRIRPLLMESAYFLCRLRERGAQGVAESGTGSCSREPEALYQAFHEEYEGILAPFLAAIEMIHSSSLVHDDLPCMDNDRLRRGKPSTWAKYGEDMGTLAGDGLMIYAFETACKAKSSGQAEGQAERVLKAIRILAQKTGIFGMIGGQTVDVALTGKPITPEELEFIYRLKTGALLEAAMMIGGVLAGAGADTVRSLELAASELGMAFQIQDDILDETGSEEDLGKPVGSDERNCKTTYVKLYGLTAAEEAVRSCTERAEKELLAIGEYPFLMELCGYLIQRKH